MVDQNFQLTLNGSALGITNPQPITQAPKAPNQTLKTFTGTSATSTSATTIVNTGYTVPAGKTFYVTDIVITNNSSNASAASVNSSVTAGAGILAIGHSINTSPFTMINIGSEPSVAAGSPLTIQLGQTATATTCAYTVYGYEQ